MPADAQTGDSGNRSESFAPCIETDLGLPGARRGKVRDVYELPRGAGGTGPRLLVVATDRLSAYDVVLPTPIPGKGVLLTSVAAFWLRWIESRGLCRTHLISTDAGEIPASAFTAQTPRPLLEGRVTIGRRCAVLPVEFVVRGYLEGSGWADYQATGRVCGIELPRGLERCAKLPEPIFTPATKAAVGEHDENIDEARAIEAIGADRLAFCRDRAVAIYTAAAAYAKTRGLLLADTKFEFGLPMDAGGETAADAEPILIDEALTPDSSRFWPAEGYAPGRTQPSFDKQFVREHLESLVARGDWDKTAPGPELPGAVIAGTLSRYREASSRLIG